MTFNRILTAKFHKILIANRGEIACRVIRTCRRLGVETAAVYSEAEGLPLHAEMADGAAALPAGASPVAEYLNIEAIVDAAVEAGAQAVHPGYGFLSENAAFAEACERAGIAFIGPPAEIIGGMGNKGAARRRMERAGVPVLPGADVPVRGGADARALADSVGFPLIVKASEGGGGIGMQLVESADRLDAALRMARSSARRSFGSEEIYMEKFIRSARHVEAQILADGQGNSVHLWERECSVQRRRQKVIEEAPSPSIPADVRARLLDAARGAAERLGYSNAGTFEFLVDEDDSFYFMEVNTRLQVEHPATEMITGVDIVERQLRIAAGEALDTRIPPVRGHAIQCRLYAEDPWTFIPSPGKLTEFRLPKMSHLRVDTGFREGDEATPYFDPMLAKIIAWGAEREDAIALMDSALAQCRIGGVKTNIPALRRVLADADFLRGKYDTDILARIQAAR